MAMSKLTLTAPPEVIELAEEQAKQENTSISAMFVNFVVAKSKSSRRKHSDIKIGPLTRSLSGIVKLPDDFDEKDFISQAFSEKYGLDK